MENWLSAGCLYSPLGLLLGPASGHPSEEDLTSETHLSAERAPPQAPARLSRTDGDTWRPGDPQAPPRQGSEAPLRLRAYRELQRRHRLSRSKDFDAVYRQGMSASTRYLTLHWFPREEDPDGEPRLGLAVPRAVGSAVARNRVKRQLRECWRSLLGDVPRGRDYVLVARPGVAEPADVRGVEWLSAEIAEMLTKARA